MKNLTILFLFTSFIISSCTKESPEPDLTAGNIGTFEGVITEDYVADNIAKVRSTLIMNITKIDIKTLRIAYTQKFEYLDKTGKVLESDSQIVTLEKVKMIDDRSFNIDEEVTNQGEKIKMKGVGVRTGDRLSVSLKLTASDGSEAGGNVELIRK